LVSSLFPGKVTWVNNVSDILKKNINLEQFRLVIYSPLFIKKLYKIQPNRQIKIIGISLAFDLILNKYNLIKKTRIKKNIGVTNGVIVDSKLTKNILKNEHTYKGSILQSVYGIKNYYSNGRKSIDLSKNTILVNRNWSKTHNNELILRSMKYLKDLDLNITFAGEGELKIKITKKYEDVIKSRKIKILKNQSKIGVKRLLEKNWIFLSASKIDGTSISLVEALSMGRICIVTDFPSNREIIKHGENGFLFKNGQPKDLAKIIRMVISISPKRLDLISSKARITGNKLGDWNRNGDAIRKFVNSFYLG
jgi:glycosyltransferase involved in cell wall biosynthesis